MIFEWFVPDFASLKMKCKRLLILFQPFAVDVFYGKEAVKLITEQGYTFAEAGRNLGVNPNLISRWKKEIEGVSGTELSPASVVSIQSELKRLRKENKQLRIEREILKKKAAAFFAKESG